MTQGAAEDLWHLSIDDLFVTPVETPPLEGPGPFVINLSASTAPISIPATGVSGFEKLKLYQLSRKEDGRDRFRLRLGFFDTPAAANEALAALRERYPSAFATNATEDDQRFNPARPRPPKAEPVVVAAAQNSPGHGHARNAVRSDSGRRGKKKDVRRDHAAHARGIDTHGAQRNKPATRNGHEHGQPKRALPVAQLSAIKEEKIDIESILLAALAPVGSDKPPSAPGKPQPAPGKNPHQNNARHAARPGHGSKHSRSHSKSSEAKHHAPRPVTKSSAPAPNVAAPPVASPAASQPVATKLEIPTPIPALIPAQPVEANQPAKSPALVDPPAVLAEAAQPAPSSAPERIEASADVDNEANIVTHPRLDEAPAAHDEVPDADIPIDLHFIDRIFDDDTPTVEVLALESPGTPPAAEQEPKEIVEPTAAKQEPAKEVAPEPKAIATRPSTESEAPAISAHDIIALLTQPINTLRASQNKRPSIPAVAPAPLPAPVAPPAAQAAAETSSVDRISPVSTPQAEPETQPAAATTTTVEDEIPTLTQVATAESPPSAPASVQEAEVPSLAPTLQSTAEADVSIGAIAAGIESELELMLPAEVSVVAEAPAATAEPAAKVDEAPSAAPAVALELELVPEPPTAPALSEVFDEVMVEQVIPARRAPPPVAKSHVEVPVTTAAAQPVAAPPARLSAPAAQLPAESIFKVKNRPAPTKTAPPAPPAAPAIKRPVVIFDAPVEDMDSTQTLRALTPLELNDDSQSKWFAVQLALSEDPVKVESLPHIDIFDEYRLYSISGIDQGKFLHSLRLGFFSAESSAQAVAGYLGASFEGAAVKRVSIAEHDRFAERKAKPVKKAEPETLAAKRGAVQSGPTPSSSTPARGNGSTPKTARKPRGSVDSAPTGRHRTLGEQLYDEAREVALSQSAIRRIPKNSSLWSRLFGQGKDKQ